MAANIHQIRPAPRFAAPSYNEGVKDGMNYADERYFWMGFAAGVLFIACILLACWALRLIP